MRTTAFSDLFFFAVGRARLRTGGTSDSAALDSRARRFLPVVELEIGATSSSDAAVAFLVACIALDLALARPEMTRSRSRAQKRKTHVEGLWA
jgi:hypothetical protein